jgi:uncharacterized protein (TIGR03790 family)
MKLPLLITLLFMLVGSLLANPAEVIVLANSSSPKSMELARYYLKQRGIPADNLIALPMSEKERINRSEYIDQIQTPLLDALRDKKFISQRPRANIFKGERRIHWATSEVRFRYLVSMFGVPVRINNTKSKPLQALQNRAGYTDQMFRRDGAAVDTELACLLLEDYDRAGVHPNPYYDELVVNNPINGLFYIMATRLDGPTPQNVRDMIDQSIQHERYGLLGGAYFDIKGAYPLGNYWLIESCERFKREGFECYKNANDNTWGPEFPMYKPAVYLGWYAEHVNGPFTVDGFKFQPGAIAYHLHSFSGMKLRTDSEYWAGPLIARGATATMGCVDEPYLKQTPNLLIFSDRLLRGYNLADSMYMSMKALSWQMTLIGDPLYQPMKLSLEENIRNLEADNHPDVDWAYIRIINGLVRGTQFNIAMDYCRNKINETGSLVLREKLADLYAANNLMVDAKREFLKLMREAKEPALVSRCAAKSIYLCKLVRAEGEADAIKAEALTLLQGHPTEKWLDQIVVPQVPRVSDADH